MVFELLLLAFMISLHFERVWPQDPYENHCILQGIPKKSYLYHFILKGYGLRVPMKTIVFYKEPLGIPTCITSF